MSPTNEDIIQSWSSADPEAFGEEGDFARRHLLNPAILDLLGAVAGQRILDAGCGQGYLSRMVARSGALVTAIEPAESFDAYAVARESRERLGITYLQRDLSKFEDTIGPFDATIANMVLMDIAELVPAMQFCIATLVPGGRFIFSLSHPCFEESGTNWPEKRRVETQEYFDEHVRPQKYGWLFHRPLCTYLNLTIDLGCAITRVLEPQLAEEVTQEIGNDRDVHVPSFIIVASTRR